MSGTTGVFCESLIYEFPNEVETSPRTKAVRGEVSYHHISRMQEVVPRVVAIAVSTVMTKCRIFCQSSFFMVVFLIYEFFLLFIHYSLSF